jgi:hypothetical protein
MRYYQRDRWRRLLQRSPHWCGHLSLLMGLSLASAVSAQSVSQVPHPAPTESVIVSETKAPLDKILHDFIFSYTAPSPASGKVARWHAGVCPGVTGLPPSWDKSVTARVREVASLAGAPVAPEKCRPNIDIIFTKSPQTLLDEAHATKSWLLGYHDAAQEKQLSTVSHAVQAWYLTQTVDSRGGVFTDDKLHPEGIDIQVRTSSAPTGNTLQFPSAHVEYWNGSHLGDERRSELMHVLVVVDLSKVDGIQLSAVADNVAMLSLAQTSAFDVCQPLTSIANLTTPGCDARLKTDKVSASDLAYLHALYSIDLRNSLIQQQGELAFKMKKSLGAP